MLHSLLLRILKRCGLAADPAAAIPPTAEQWQAVLDQVSRVITEADQHRELMERSLALSSEEMRANAEQLRQARDEAQAANVAKSAFLANMSHEIRTPMTAILGFADLLLNPAILPEQVHDYVQTIRRNGEHLLAIINDILDVSKVEAGRMQIERVPMSPIQLARDVVQSLSARASKKGLALEVTCRTSLPRIMHTDPTRVRQILMNLVGNAIKFTDKGGIRVALSLQQIQNGHVIQFEVIDTGIGISPDQISKLFQPFAQADITTTRRFGGTGLGLTISKRLAQLLGGDIRVSSAPDAGSTFLVELPVEASDPSSLIDPISAASLRVSPINPSPARVDCSGRGLEDARILLAEDGPDNQRLISFHLTKAGAVVDIAGNGALACDMATQALVRGEPYHIVLMDMQMPEMDGYAATAYLRRAGYRLPILALTAHAMEGDRVKCLSAGCDEFAVKPVDRAQLLALCVEFARRARHEISGPAMTGDVDDSIDLEPTGATS
jgi:signal transduction histidine kinase/AmiR/NasT family two-component response regulator